MRRQGAARSLTTLTSMVKYSLVWILSFSALSLALSLVKPEMSAKSIVAEKHCQRARRGGAGGKG